MRIVGVELIGGGQSYNQYAITTEKQLKYHGRTVHFEDPAVSLDRACAASGLELNLRQSRLSDSHTLCFADRRQEPAPLDQEFVQRIVDQASTPEVTVEPLPSSRLILAGRNERIRELAIRALRNQGLFNGVRFASPRDNVPPEMFQQHPEGGLIIARRLRTCSEHVATQSLTRILKL